MQGGPERFPTEYSPLLTIENMVGLFTVNRGAEGQLDEWERSLEK